MMRYQSIYKILKCIVLLCVAGIVVPSVQAQSLEVYKAHTRVELIPQFHSLKEGQSFYIGLKLKSDKDWHTYWRNPGDSGLATSIQWELPEGFMASPIQWPYPHRIEAPPLVTYGYDNEAFLSIDITAPPDFKQRTEIPIKAKVSWLSCKVECIPGVAHFSFSIPVAEESKVNNVFKETYYEYRTHYPSKDLLARTSAALVQDEIIIQYIPTLHIPHIKEGYFFPYDSGIIDNAAVQKFSAIDKGYRFNVKKSPLYKKGKDDRLRGILYFYLKNYDPIRPIEIDVPIGDAIMPILDDEAQNKKDINILIATIFAFIGGIILNLMPCVLPVLSIKVLSLVEKKDQPRNQLVSGGIKFTLGIVVSFWVLAGVMLLLRYAGRHIGWGFQFQSPVFVVCMSILFFYLALNLFGVFEIGTGLTTLKSTEHAFLNGVLATIVATPCTAPYMGSAIGFALNKPPVYVFIIFTSLGMGMAFPYFILSQNPKLLKYIPKPGPWMMHLKQFFGFVLMAVVIWLSWVLSLQKGGHAIIVLLTGLLFIGLACWVNSLRKPESRLIWIVGLLWFLGLFFCFQSARQEKRVSNEKPVVVQQGIEWQDYAQEQVDAYLATNQPIFINFTAAWCLSCQVNDKMVFQNPKVVARFKKSNVIAIKADWTNYDPQITKALNEFGKNSIPLYVLYTKNKQEGPIVLPELITPNLVINKLNKYLID